MISDFLAWSLSILRTLVEWLGSMQIADGVSLLAFFVATFVLGLLIRTLLVR